MPTQCLNADTWDIYTFACPSHGWEAIQDYIYTTSHSLDPHYLALTGVVHSPNWVGVTGHGSQRRLSITDRVDTLEGYDQEQCLATTQQSAVADALTETGDLWDMSVANISTSGHGSVLQRQDAVHAINDGYYQPYTITSCASDVIRGPQDDSAVAFPVPPGVEASLMLNENEYNDSALDVYSFVGSGITKDQIFATPGSTKESRLKWVELPQDPFNGSAIGAVILLPRSAINLTQEILVCNLGAGWGSSIINTSSFDGATGFTTSVVGERIHTDETSINRSNPSTKPLSIAESEAGHSVTSFDRPFFPDKPIIVTELWANYLNPFMPALNTTVIDALMSTYKSPEDLSPRQRVLVAKWALGGLLANGLASIGAAGTLQGNIKTVVKPDGSSAIDGDRWFSGKRDMFTVDPEESKDWVKLRVDTNIDGYAYNIRGTPPKVAISFLLAYCIVALSHVLYAGITGKSSLPNLMVNTNY